MMKTIIALFLLAIVGLLSCQSSKTSKSKQASTQSTNKDVASAVSVGKNLSYKPFSEFKGDTLQYLNYNFVEHKEQYIGKSFSVLYNDLEIPVKSCLGGPDANNQLVSSSIILSFYDSETERYIMNTVGPSVPTSYSVIVKWEKPLSAESLFQLYKASDGNWTPSYEVLLNKEIVKDVAVLKYVNPQSTKQ